MFYLSLTSSTETAELIFFVATNEKSVSSTFEVS